MSDITAHIDREQAAWSVFIAQELLKRIDAEEVFERKAAILVIDGYDHPKTQEELDLVVRTLRRAAYPRRTWSCCLGREC